MSNYVPDPSEIFPAATITPLDTSTYVLTLEVDPSQRPIVISALQAKNAKIVALITVGPVPPGFSASALQRVLRFRCPQALVAIGPSEKSARVALPADQVQRLLSFTHFMPNTTLRFRQHSARGILVEFPKSASSPPASPKSVSSDPIRATSPAPAPISSLPAGHGLQTASSAPVVQVTPHPMPAPSLETKHSRPSSPPSRFKDFAGKEPYQGRGCFHCRDYYDPRHHRCTSCRVPICYDCQTFGRHEKFHRDTNKLDYRLIFVDPYRDECARISRLLTADH
jgi:hypothetical protein